MNLTIHRLPAFTDNYLWLVSNEAGDALVVDPGDAATVQAALDDKGLILKAILTTHHHPDHIGGVDALLKTWHCPVYGPKSPGIPQVSHPLADGDEIHVLGTDFSVLGVPGHTLDHIAYFSASLAGSPALFAGDTLFAGGCGRLFEGSPTQMHHSLAKIARLPANTAVYCAHEYTLANLLFAAAVEPDNRLVARRLEETRHLREQKIPTVPSTLAEELKTNPFLRAAEPAVMEAAGKRLGRVPASPVESFAAIRQWKDTF